MLPLFSLSSVRSLFPPATCSSLYSFYSHSLSKRAQFFCSFRISPSEGHCWQILGCFLFENIFTCCHCEEVLSGLEFQVAPADPPVCHGKFAIVQGEVTAVRTIENCPLLASLLSISSHWLSHAIQPFTEPGSPESPRLGSFLHLDCQSPSPAPIPPRYPIFPGSALPLAPEVFAASDPSPLATAHRGLRAAFLHTDWVLFLHNIGLVRGAFSQESFRPPSHQASQPRAVSLPSCPPASVTGPFASARWCLLASLLWWWVPILRTKSLEVTRRRWGESVFV